MPQLISAILTSLSAIAVGAGITWWVGRGKEQREENKDEREEGAEERADQSAEMAVATFHREESMELRRLLSQLRLDFDNERSTLKHELATYKETNERQAREILALKGQIFDLQDDRKRQTTEGQRQTAEGKRQTEEGVRQTVEGQRLDKRRADMDDEENGQ